MSIATELGRPTGERSQPVWRLSSRAAPSETPIRAGIALTVVAGRDAIDALAPEWDALAARLDGPTRVFQSFAWHRHWSRHYADAGRQRLAVVTGRASGRLVLLWPLVVERRLGLTIASFAGAPVSQYGEILLERSAPEHEQWLHAALRFVATELKPDLLHLRKVRADSAAALLMRSAGGTPSDQQMAPSIGLDTAADGEGHEQRYGSKDRKNRRRKRRRLSEMGEIGFRRASGSAEAVAALEQAMAWKRQWLEAGGMVSTALADERFDRFFADMLRDPASRAGAETFELTLEGKPIAIKIAITAGSYRAMHFTAYDKALDKVSPGELLVEEMIKASIADGVEVLDFLAPAYTYKVEWATDSVGVADYSLPMTRGGRLFEDLYVQGLRPALQRLVKRGPAPLRRLASLAVGLLLRGSARPA